MKILLLGKNGQLGWELQRALAPLGQVTALASDAADYCGDLRQPELLAATVRQLRPDVIVNAAAWTAVDLAESEPQAAYQVNAQAVEVLAREAQQLGAWLIHYSTDYVFSGSGERPWREDDSTGPLNVYGASKLAGEQAIIAACDRHLIFRTSWVYGSRGNNFARTMLRLGQQREELAVINDQFGAPTGADLLADCSAHALVKALANPALAGVYHLAAGGTTSWYDYARLVFSEADAAGLPLALRKLNPQPTSGYPTPAQRPLNSRLDTAKFKQAFGLQLPEWQQGVQRMLAEILPLQVK